MILLFIRLGRQMRIKASYRVLRELSSSQGCGAGVNWRPLWPPQWCPHCALLLFTWGTPLLNGPRLQFNPCSSQSCLRNSIWFRTGTYFSQTSESFIIPPLLPPMAPHSVFLWGSHPDGTDASPVLFSCLNFSTGPKTGTVFIRRRMDK